MTSIVVPVVLKLGGDTPRNNVIEDKYKTFLHFNIEDHENPFSEAIFSRDIYRVKSVYPYNTELNDEQFYKSIAWDIVDIYNKYPEIGKIPLFVIFCDIAHICIVKGWDTTDIDTLTDQIFTNDFLSSYR